MKEITKNLIFLCTNFSEQAIFGAFFSQCRNWQNKVPKSFSKTLDHLFDIRWDIILSLNKFLIFYRPDWIRHLKF